MTYTLMSLSSEDSSMHTSRDAHPGDTLIGREKLVDAVASHIRNGRSVLVVGAAGMGKSAILKAVAHRTAHQEMYRQAIYCSEAATLRNTLQLLAEGLFDRQSTPPITSGPEVLSRNQFARLPIGTLRQFVLPWLCAGRYVPLLDHLARVRGAYATFLDTLVEDLNVPIVAAARSLAPADTGRLWWVGVKFAVIEVLPLSRKDAHRLIEHCLDQARINLPDRDHFANGVVQLCAGNPRTMVRLCEMAGAPQYRVHGKTDLRLLWLDLKISNLGLPPIADLTRYSLQEEVLADPLPMAPSEQNSCG